MKRSSTSVRKMLVDLARVRLTRGPPGAAENVAEMAAEILDGRPGIPESREPS